MEGAAIYRLLTWLSPAYPTGAFAYSQGLEWAVESGAVSGGASLEDWVRGILLHGNGRIDGALFAASWRAAAAGDDDRLDEVTVRGLAWRGTAEAALESEAQGRAFADVTAAAWQDAGLGHLARRHQGRIPLSVAAGVALSREVPLSDALLAYFTSFAANLVSAGVRLIPLGQTQGQSVLAGLEPAVADAARAGEAADLETIGSAAPLADLASMFHETQYSRMFRS